MSIETGSIRQYRTGISGSKNLFNKTKWETGTVRYIPTTVPAPTLNPACSIGVSCHLCPGPVGSSDPWVTYRRIASPRDGASRQWDMWWSTFMDKKGSTRVLRREVRGSTELGYEEVPIESNSPPTPTTKSNETYQERALIFKKLNQNLLYYKRKGRKYMSVTPGNTRQYQIEI